MRITRLHIAQLRCLERVSLAPLAGLNLLIGDNGAGKTSVLEAIHLMGYGRSFRGRVRDGLVRQGAGAIEVFLEWQEGQPPRARRAGLRHAGQTWEARLDGAPVEQLGDLCSALAVVTFEPGSHVLVSGGSEPRRRLLDWGLFHVEPDFLRLWRRHARALKQRNALLKAGAGDEQLDAWDRELVEAGEPLTRRRLAYLERLQPHLRATSAELLPAGGDATLEFLPGWRQDELPLADALLLARTRDRLAGFTSVGPHRADWRIVHAGLPGREGLSRGQAKLTALGLLLAQAGLHAELRGEWPVVLLDDLASELDRSHQERVLARLAASGAQVFLTGTDRPAGLGGFGTAPLGLFHVEQGQIRAEVPTAFRA
jgi:DNA replication and repair protein RecF